MLPEVVLVPLAPGAKFGWNFSAPPVVELATVSFRDLMELREIGGATGTLAVDRQVSNRW